MKRERPRPPGGKPGTVKLKDIRAAVKRISAKRRATARKAAATVALLAFVVIGGLMSWAVLTGHVKAASTDVSGALFSLIATWTNSGAVDLDDLVASFNMSLATLVDSDLVADDALNALLQKGGVDQPGMPPTVRIAVEGMVVADGDTFTDRTTQAQNATQNDIELLPITPAVNDALYFGCDNPCRILTLDIDTVGVNTLTLSLEYWDGDSYETLANVVDDTSTFTNTGRNTISWDMPTNWAVSSVTGSAVNSFWGRARVSAFTSQTTQPLGTRAFYENGQWWTWIENLATNVQEQFTLFFGGAALVSAHQIFPGAAGILTADDASIEVTGSYVFALQGRLNFTSPSATDCILCKSSVMTTNVSGTASAPALQVKYEAGSGTTVLDMSGITLPDIGVQTVIVASDGTDLVLLADAGGGLSAGKAQGGTDNGNTWTWASQGGVDYIEYARLRSAGAPTVMDVARSFTQWDTGTHTNTQAYTGAMGLDNE